MQALAAVALACATSAAAQTTLLRPTGAELLDGLPVHRLATGDIDLDGLTDVVATTRQPSLTPYTRNKVVIQRQRPAFGSSAPRFSTYRVLDAQAPQGLALTDLDGDGDLDLALAQEDVDQGLVLWHNRGDAQGGAAGAYTGPGLQFGYGPAIDVVAVDADADPASPDDLLLVRGTGLDSLLLRNPPAQQPAAVVPWQSLPHPGAAGALRADFNGDSRADLLVYGVECWVWLQRGAGLTPPYAGFRIPACDGAGMVSAAAVQLRDNPQAVDLAIGGTNGSFWLRQTGSTPDGAPVFQAQPFDAANPGGARTLQLIDADGDGDLDLLSASSAARTRVFRRIGSSFEGVLQSLPSAGSAAVAALATGQLPELWLGSITTGSGIWSVTTLPPANPGVSFPDAPAQTPVGYYYEGTIGTRLSIHPAATVDLQATIAALPPVGAGLSWQPVIESGSGDWRGIRNASAIRGEWSLQLTGVSPPGAAFIGAPSTTTTMVIARTQPGCVIACLIGGQCVGGRGGSGALEPGVFMGTLAEVDLLRRLRDERLATTSAGAHYIGLYQSLQVDLWEASFIDPRHYLRLWALKDAWMPAVENLVNGDGQMPVSAEMQALLDEALARYAAHGSQRLQQAIADEIRALDLEHLQGHPIAQLQTRWEASPLFQDGFD